jgi:long-chain acyl-CoA synthetase
MPTFYDRFLEHAVRQPQSVAVEIQKCDSIESYTYEELRRMAEAVARWLISHGLELGARAAIVAENHPHWFAAYLGIIAAGAVVVPLDTALSPGQAAVLLKDSGCVCVFCHAKYLPLAREAAIPAAQIVVLDSESFVRDLLARSQSVRDASRNLEPEVEFHKILFDGPEKFTPQKCAGDSLAALLYTSGTTADPKGVMLTHSNLMGELDAALGWAPLGPRDAVLGVLPLFHVLAQITNFVVPLSVGARVVFLESLNSTELLRALSERKITAFSVVPQFFYLIHDRIFKQIAARGKGARVLVRSLMVATQLLRKMGMNPGKIVFAKVHGIFGDRMHYLLSAGSHFDTKIARDLHSLGLDVMQAYGLTETTAAVFATAPGKVVIGSVGPPLAGVEARIADAEFDPALGRDVGEVTVRGKMVMKGYWNRAAATAEVLHDGWFSTGDLGYLDGRGNLFITGRKKEVIILGNGKNVYPAEVEAHYLKSPFIKEICVLGLRARAGDPASERLYAVVVPDFDELKKRKIVNARDVLRFDIEGLSAELPSTKRIGNYEIWQEDLPRTTTRKVKRFEVERRVLLRQSALASADGVEAAKPLSTDELLWQQRPEVQPALAVFGDLCKANADAIRPDANLELDLEFDSMQRVELIAALEQALGRRGDDAQYAEAYTVRQLVDAVLDHDGSSSKDSGAAASLAWRKILADDPQTQEVLALAKRRPIAQRALRLSTLVAKAVGYGPFRLRVSGIDKLPRRGPLLLCPNHQSLMDSTILASILPWPVFEDLFAVGTSEVFSSGIMHIAARCWRIIVVDPDANLIPAMRAAAFGLKHGRTLLLFPEGERSIDGEPKMFKRGAAILSIHLQIPIVPVAIEGFHDAWPRGQSLPRPVPLQIMFGDPILPPPETEASFAAYEEFTEDLRGRVVAMWEELRSRRR